MQSDTAVLDLTTSMDAAVLGQAAMQQVIAREYAAARAIIE